jgi:hypothetical protein
MATGWAKSDLCGSGLNNPDCYGDGRHEGGHHGYHDARRGADSLFVDVVVDDPNAIEQLLIVHVLADYSGLLE